MAKLKEFKHDKLGTLHATTINGNVWFVAKDLMTLLWYSESTIRNADKLVEDKVYPEDRVEYTEIFHEKNWIYGNCLVNISGAYNLIYQRNVSLDKPKIYFLLRWLTDDVISVLMSQSGDEELTLHEQANEWKYKVAYPIMKDFFDVCTDQKTMFCIVYRCMGKHFKFDETRAIKEYEAKFPYNNYKTAIINAIAINPQYREMFLRAMKILADEKIKVCNTNLEKIDNLLSSINGED